jgi:hypothetical protein
MSETNTNDRLDKEDDVPENIDFSGGVRGKYVRRYREGVSIRELPPIDPIRFYEMQSRLGHALRHAQALERTLVVYLALVFDMPPHAAGTEASQLLESRSSNFLLRLGEELRLEYAPGPELESRLREFLAERNWLVHRSRHHLEEELSLPAQAQALTNRLELLVDEAQYLNQKLARLLEHRLLQRGLSGAEIQSRTREVVERWAAA